MTTEELADVLAKLDLTLTGRSYQETAREILRELTASARPPAQQPPPATWDVILTDADQARNLATRQQANSQALIAAERRRDSERRATDLEPLMYGPVGPVEGDQARDGE